MASSATGSKCCCGRADCAYLQHNDTALGGLERDLDTAARLGQALLTRHESYISDSQAEHARLSAHIAELESERTSLQSANEKIVAENRDLLSRLESLNSSLATSDGEVKRLEDLLFDCELELKRLNGLVRRTEDLDGRVQEMERERVALNRQLSEGRDEVRGTLARWRESERKVRELEEDMHRIEREANAERQRHEEIMARMDRERALERELGGAEGRLKGAAAMSSIKNNAPGSKSVVSHFVRDILQDNANLQAGIAELRELLQSSNEEVQNLREQVLLHQPVADESMENTSRLVASLGDELAQVQPSPQQVQQEVHVHHHYHAKLAKKEKPSIPKRPSRRRAMVSSQGYTSDASSPSTPLSRPQRFNTSPVALMNLHHPQPRRNNRWSIQSTATQSSVFSSMPSSPRSYFDRSGSMFDRMEQGEDSSRPTSPESVADLSSSVRKSPSRVEEFGLGVFGEEYTPTSDILSPIAQETIEEEPIIDHEPEVAEDIVHTETPKPDINIRLEPDGDNDTTPRALHPGKVDAVSSINQDIAGTSSTALDHIPEIRPSLNRRGSHESLVSISGMDIHLAQRPSPATTLRLLRGNSAHFALSPAQSNKVSTAIPLASVTEYTVLSAGFEATPSPGESIRRMPSGIEALSGIAVPAARSRTSKTASSSSGLTNLVGGWVRGKWGIAPTKSVGGLRSVSMQHATTKAAIFTGANDTGSSSTASVYSSSSTETTSNSHKSVPDAKTASSLSGPPEVNLKPQDDESMTAPVPVASPPKPIPQHQTRALDGNKALTYQPATRSISSSQLEANFLAMGRSPGVNQRGFIPGLRAAILSKPTPTDVLGRVLDEDALREGLGE